MNASANKTTAQSAATRLRLARRHFQPGGVGHAGSGRHPTGGRKPGGGVGHSGAGTNRGGNTCTGSHPAPPTSHPPDARPRARQERHPSTRSSADDRLSMGHFRPLPAGPTSLRGGVEGVLSASISGSGWIAISIRRARRVPVPRALADLPTRPRQLDPATKIGPLVDLRSVRTQSARRP